MYGLEFRLGLISDYSNYFSIITLDCFFHDLNCVDWFTVSNSLLIFYYTCACVILITEYLPYLANSCFPYIVVGHIIFVLRGFELSTLVVRRPPVGPQSAPSSKQGICLPGSVATRQNLVPESKTKDETTVVVVMGVVLAIESWCYSLLGWYMEPQPVNAENV